MDIDRLKQRLVDGDRPGVTELVRQALDAGEPALSILNQALIPGMGTVGELFEQGEYFVPELLLSARAMYAALDLLRPHLIAGGVAPAGRVVIGTVQGDLHDIGKNLVAMMLKGANFGIVDLGTNVAPDKFVDAAREHNAQLICLSALLTTTMPAMKTTVQAVRSAGLASAKIMVGGAPVTQDYANEIGADGYSPDAASAVDLALRLAETC